MTKNKENIVKLNESSVVILLEEMLQLAKEGKISNILAVGDTVNKDYYVAFAEIDIHDTYRFTGYLSSYAAVETILTSETDDFE